MNSEIRRYDMVHDQNNAVAWKMTRTPEGQYVPYIDVEKMKKDHYDAERERFNDTTRQHEEVVEQARSAGHVAGLEAALGICTAEMIMVGSANASLKSCIQLIVKAIEDGKAAEQLTTEDDL